MKKKLSYFIDVSNSFLCRSICSKDAAFTSKCSIEQWSSAEWVDVTFKGDSRWQELNAIHCRHITFGKKHLRNFMKNLKKISLLEPWVRGFLFERLVLWLKSWCLIFECLNPLWNQLAWSGTVYIYLAPSE